MSAKNRTPAEIQRSFVQHVQNISAHNRGISDELALMSQGLRDGIQSNTGPTTDLLAAASELSRFAMRACTNLSSCLEDLVNMGEAMAPVLAANPEAAEPLLLNFFSTFVTQMGAFYNEIDAWWGKGCESLGRGKAAFFRESSVSNTALATREPTASTAPTGAMPTADREREVSETAAVSTVHAGRRRNHQLLEDDVADGEPPPAHDCYSESAPGGAAPKKGRKKKATTAAEAEASATAATTPTTKRTQNFDPLPNSQSSRGSAEDTMAGLAAAAESGAQTALPQRPEKSSSRSVLPVADELAELTPEDLNALAQSEPSYLFLTSTLEDALGAVVMASRPNVFSNLASFTYNEPVSTYYIRLIRPGSLAYFVYCNYILGSADTQADFLCDVLETDCAEVDPFTSPAGEVIVEDAADLSSLPACAWAIGSSEDNERRLYTMYALIEQPPRVGPTAIIQDSLNMGAARDEVLHMVTLVDGAPEFARVTCMVYSEMRTAEIPTQKQAAILSFSRSGFAHTGFVEVPDSEVEAAVSRMRRKKQNAAGYKTVLFSKQELDATTTFQPPVQLASLNQPAGDAGISLGGVARGAVQGGFEVLKAPFTVGRAVGGALLDATGVTGAVRNNIEGVFRKSFPDLAGETLLDSFNCAWVEGSALKQGYLFITPHWLCFQSTLAAAHFSIEYDEIKDIIKSKSVKMFENAIEVKTHLNDTIFLTNFLQRDQAYSALMSQWLKQ
ncbi:hypothetical protein, conserved [Leishmania donovani]|uniref:GRAM domain containing protein, putative n=1 Tax=Leishmania donovani TaxID=5661 RepID=E9BM15_LEIDO|nr:hypothetical protein, conserved [Leishmania donovani]AYU81072.1 GRAM domain containing protein, putative [Leishmania donovani]CBZ36293.1 hypothetical protein, conserved [Leishmania donovani]